MRIKSLAFANSQKIPKKYTCDGAGISPPLSISDVPKDTQSLALVVDDPDSPSGTWVHWTVWNIEPLVTDILEATTPDGVVEGITSFGDQGYGGPCPASGTHRYFFKVYALDTKLNLSEEADKTELFEAMKGRILDEAELIGLYTRDR